VGFTQINYQEGVIIPEVFTAENSVAKQAGMQAGNIVLAINDQPLGLLKMPLLTSVTLFNLPPINP
jgi:S1-C subfamily serine protease